MSLLEDIDLPRGQRIQLRVEAFNLFNQVHLDQPSGTIGTVATTSRAAEAEGAAGTVNEKVAPRLARGSAHN